MAGTGNPNWKKGVSGNPAGRPRIPDDLKKSCRRLAARGMKVLEEIILSRTEFETIDGKLVKTKSAATPSEKTAAIKLMLEYGYGKPVQPLGGEKEDGGILVEIIRFSDEKS